MKCQHCGKNEATTHIRQTINGETAEAYLCPQCAQQAGVSYGDFFKDMHSDFENLLGSFFSNVLPARSEASRCKTCGSTYAEIARTGKVGCADCYSEFYDKLLPSIRRMHGNTTHCGKRAHSASAPLTESADSNEKSIEQLKAELDAAVKAQNFEKAAELRDKIKELE